MRWFKQLLLHVRNKIEAPPEPISARIMSLIAEPITSSKERSLRLQELITEAQKHLKCDGIEVCLFDKQSKSYRQSITSGIPFSAPVDEMPQYISVAPPNSLVEGIRFAGQMIGVLRASFSSAPSEAKHTAFTLYAQQVSLIVTNSDFINEIQKARKLQDDSLKAKTGFLASLSHELRGPLGVILNASEIMHDEMVGSVNEQQKEMLKMILNNGEHLLELLNDVLDYARVEAGKVQPKRVSIAVPDILDELAQLIQVQAAQKKQTVTVEALMQGSLLCDRKHFRQIAINLLTNAVKYTPSGGSIAVRAERLAGGRCKISVIDTGCGIKQSDFPKVFGAFERINHGYASEQHGTGVGLSLTKRLVEINGGYIDFTSEFNSGSSFHIIFPELLAADVGEEILQPDHTHKTDPMRRPSYRIVFVGKRTEEVTIITEYLKNQGVEIIHASSAESMTKAEMLPDVIMVDDSAKGFLSEDPFNQIRKEVGGFSVPLMYLSRDAFTFSVEEQLRMGVDLFVAKPIFLRDLVDHIASVVISDENDVTRKSGGIISQQRLLH